MSGKIIPLLVKANRRKFNKKKANRRKIPKRTNIIKFQKMSSF